MDKNKLFWINNHKLKGLLFILAILSLILLQQLTGVFVVNNSI